MMSVFDVVRTETCHFSLFASSRFVAWQEVCVRSKSFAIVVLSVEFLYVFLVFRWKCIVISPVIKILCFVMMSIILLLYFCYSQ